MRGTPMRGGAICHSCSAPRFAAIALAIIGSIGQSHATEAGLAQMELVENSVFGPEASSVAATGFSAAEGGEIQNITFDLANTDPLGVSRFAPTPQQGPPTLARLDRDPHRYSSLGTRLGAAKWETIGIFAYITASQAYWTKGTTSFHFKDEGWFGQNTKNLGIDKLTHAFNTYLFSEFLGARIAAKTGDRVRAAAPAALIASGLAMYGELWDAHKKDSGFSPQDVLFNTGGAIFSVLRHAVPGLENKLDFRLLLMPNSEVYSFKGKRHYEQQRFLLSLELAGFDGLQKGPFRFIEIQAGYRGKDFTNADRAAGVTPKRDLFFGIAINIKESFLKNKTSGVAKALSSGLNYFQIPYTGVYDY